MHVVTISVSFYIIPCEIIVQNKDNHLVPYMHIQTILHYCLFMCNINSRSSVLLRSLVTNISVLQLNIKQEEVLTDLQQNSFNLQSGHSENLIIQYMRRVVPRLQVLLFTRGGKKKLNHWCRQISGTCSESPPRVFVHQMLWYLLTPCILLINFSCVDSRKYRGLWWPWTSSSRGYPNRILL